MYTSPFFKLWCTIFLVACLWPSCLNKVSNFRTISPYAATIFRQSLLPMCTLLATQAQTFEFYSNFSWVCLELARWSNHHPNLNLLYRQTTLAACGHWSLPPKDCPLWLTGSNWSMDKLKLNAPHWLMTADLQCYYTPLELLFWVMVLASSIERHGIRKKRAIHGDWWSQKMCSLHQSMHQRCMPKREESQQSALH
jgi:hypothetical protein